MDKKKVICHVDDAVAFLNNLRNYVNGYNNNSNLTNALKALEMASEELQKPDWISVDEELPQYEEDVLVCNKEEPSDMWFGHRTLRGDVVVDEHGFAKSFEKITHWRKIEKLEV